MISKDINKYIFFKRKVLIKKRKVIEDKKFLHWSSVTLTFFYLKIFHFTYMYSTRTTVKHNKMKMHETNIILSATFINQSSHGLQGVNIK